MKHIKKYNESKVFDIEEYIDIEYIGDCFSNLINYRNN